MVYGMAFIQSVHMGEVFGAWGILSEFWISVVFEIWLLYFFSFGIAILFRLKLYQRYLFNKSTFSQISTSQSLPAADITQYDNALGGQSPQPTRHSPIHTASYAPSIHQTPSPSSSFSHASPIATALIPLLRKEPTQPGPWLDSTSEPQSPLCCLCRGWTRTSRRVSWGLMVWV